jgi:GNAT superfamily N-acetyltransferase
MQLEASPESSVEALTAEDIPDAMELKNALGWNQTPEDWERFLRLAPEGAFKLRVAGQLAGTAVAFVFEDVCWIGMVIVAETHRGRGYGNLLMQRCLDHAASRRCTLVQLDATRDGVSLYARLGFRPSHLVGTCHGRIVPPVDELVAAGEPRQGAPRRGAAVGRAAGAGGAGNPNASSSGHTLTPAGRRYLQEIAELEAEALGTNRQALLRELVEPEGPRGLVCHGPSGQLLAFLLYRPGHHSIQIGPLIARDEGAALVTLQSAFREICGRNPACDVTLSAPLYNEAMLAELRRWGLPVSPRLTRMYRGRQRLQAREDMVYALSGPEKG